MKYAVIALLSSANHNGGAVVIWSKIYLSTLTDNYALRPRTADAWRWVDVFPIVSVWLRREQALAILEDSAIIAMGKRLAT